MSELNSIELDSSETIQDIALKLVTEQLKNDSHLKIGPSERTIFVLGSKGAVSVWYSEYELVYQNVSLLLGKINAH